MASPRHDTKLWIALGELPGMGPAHLIEIHEALAAKNLALSDLAGLSAPEVRDELHLAEKTAEAVTGIDAAIEKIDQDYSNILDAGISVIPFFDNRYPVRLTRTLHHAIPPFLYTLGAAELLNSKAVAILGDKDVSNRGELISFEAARELVHHDITVVSGFARGADLIAHRAALSSGGTTIAVVPYGLFHFKVPDFLQDVFDPARVVIVSPFYPTREANKFQAFIRNKIACAMSCAVYLVEAPEDGGIFEAAKSASNLKVPLFTTEYAQYPRNALGNARIISELGGKPVRGRMDKDLLTPNMEAIIAEVKFNS